MNSPAKTSVGATVAVFVVAAATTFVLAAAASAIVASSGAGSDARETRFAATQIVVSPRATSLGGVPHGARVIAFKNVDGPALSASGDGGDENTETKTEGAKVVVIGRATLSAARFDELLRARAQRWAEVEPDESKQLSSAAIDIGVQLRSTGYLGLVLPAGFLANSNACAIADGFYRGGVVPVFRFPATSVAQLNALRSCTGSTPRRPNTVLVSTTDNSGLPPSEAHMPRGVTVIHETALADVVASLAGGASAVLVEDARRSAVVRRFVRQSAIDGQRELVLAASRRLDEWFANLPPVGLSPPTTREKSAAKKRTRRYKNDSRSPETGSPVGKSPGGKDGGGKQNNGKNPTPPPTPAPQSEPDQGNGNNVGGINAPSSR